MTFKQARMIAGLSQSEVAKRLGIARTTIANWERGASKPTPANIRKVVDLFGIRADELSFF